MQSLKDKTVLVSGGTGFIGSYVTTYLHTAGADVRLISRNTRGHNVITCDLANKSEVTQKINLNVDHVIHLAAFVPRNSREDLRETCMDQNFQATVNIFDAVRDTLSGRFCYVSTLEVYGKPAYLPIDENHPTNPLSFYGASKLFAEKILEIMASKSGIPLVILRLSNVFGPGEKIERAIPNFIRSILYDTPPEIHGDGSDIRDYVYVEDVAKGILLSLESGQTGLYNLGSGVGRNILEVAKTISKVARKNIEPKFLPRKKDQMDVIFNPEKARRTFSFSPETDFEEGIGKEIEWFKRGSQ